MKTIQRVVLVVALSLFLGSRAEAAMLNLDFAVTINEPSAANLHYRFFESEPPANGIKYGFNSQQIVRGQQTILGMTPGTYHFSLTVDVANLSNFYFASYGSVQYPQPWFTPSLFAAAPLNGTFDGGYAWAYGPPWVSLETMLGGRLSNRMLIFDGLPNPLTGFTAGSWELNVTESDQVPEPTSLVLLGTGAAVLLRRHLTKKKSAVTRS